MAPFISQCLSHNVLKTLIKAGVLGLDYNKALSSLDYNKALGNMTALYRALGNSSSEVQIPLPEAEKIQEKPNPRRPEELTDVEIEQAILPVFDYFDANLQVLNSSLGDKTKEMVMTRVWKVILNVIEGLLVPPLADTPSEMKPLSDKEVDIVFKWLKVGGINVIHRHPVEECIFSFFETISMQMERVLYRWNRYKIRSIVTSFPFACITTGIRTL